MARKGKEPAGLRRYRLAQKRKKKTRRVRAAPKRRKTSMARRRYRRKGSRKKDKAIPLLMFAPVVPAAVRVASEGISASTPKVLLFELTGYSTDAGGFNMSRVYRQAGLVLAGMVGHKIAGRTGINRAMKKLTFGYLKL